MKGQPREHLHSSSSSFLKTAEQQRKQRTHRSTASPNPGTRSPGEVLRHLLLTQAPPRPQRGCKACVLELSGTFQGLLVDSQPNIVPNSHTSQCLRADGRAAGRFGPQEPGRFVSWCESGPLKGLLSLETTCTRRVPGQGLQPTGHGGLAQDGERREAGHFSRCRAISVRLPVGKSTPSCCVGRRRHCQVHVPKRESFSSLSLVIPGNLHPPPTHTQTRSYLLQGGLPDGPSAVSGGGTPLAGRPGALWGWPGTALVASSWQPPLSPRLISYT